MKEKPMKKGLVKAKTLTRDQAAELRELEALPDDQIDTGDIPEIADWSEARRGVFHQPAKQQITLRLDADVVVWFKEHATDSRGYQARINHALREYVQQHSRTVIR